MFLYFTMGACMLYRVVLLSRRKKLVNEFDFYVVAVIREFVYNFTMGFPVNIC